MHRVRSFAACLVALGLLAGCTTSSEPKTELAGQVEKVVDAAGHQMITRLVIKQDPADLRVVFRTPTGETSYDPAGTALEQVGGVPLGATRPDAIDYGSLEEQFAEVAAQCPEEPWVTMIVSATGAIVSASHCADEVVSWNVDGRDIGPVEIDLLSVAGIEQLMAEADIFLPPGGIYYFSLPGPASVRGDVARVDGQLWVLGDFSECMTLYMRPGKADEVNPLPGFQCDTRELSSTDRPDLFLPSSLDVDRVQEALGQALAESGFEESEVVLYLYYQMTFLKQVWILSDADGQRFTYEFEAPA